MSHFKIGNGYTLPAGRTNYLKARIPRRNPLVSGTRPERQDYCLRQCDLHIRLADNARQCLDDDAAEFHKQQHVIWYQKFQQT